MDMINISYVPLASSDRLLTVKKHRDETEEVLNLWKTIEVPNPHCLFLDETAVYNGLAMMITAAMYFIYI